MTTGINNIVGLLTTEQTGHPVGMQLECVVARVVSKPCPYITFRLHSSVDGECGSDDLPNDNLSFKSLTPGIKVTAIVDKKVEVS